MRLQIDATREELGEPDAEERLSKALHKALDSTPPRGGEVQLVTDMAERSARRYEDMLKDMVEDIVRFR